MSDGPFVVTVESEELERNWAQAASGLERDSRLAANIAADAGVAAMQNRHPYTDRTGNLSFSMHGEGNLDAAWDEGGTVYEAEMIADADYASFVDWGTENMYARPFTPIGEKEAERTLTREEEIAVERFERSCTRG